MVLGHTLSPVDQDLYRIEESIEIPTSKFIALKIAPLTIEAEWPSNEDGEERHCWRT